MEQEALVVIINKRPFRKVLSCFNETLDFGEGMPKAKVKRKEGFGFSDVLMLLVVVFFIWFVLKSFHLVDPPEDYATYVLEAILGIMITAWYTESRDFRKRTITQGMAIVEMKTKIEYLEKGFNELRTQVGYKKN
jgi:hypothetical protein